MNFNPRKEQKDKIKSISNKELKISQIKYYNIKKINRTKR